MMLIRLTVTAAAVLLLAPWGATAATTHESFATVATFAPFDLEISEGDSVHWTWMDPLPHSVTFTTDVNGDNGPGGNGQSNVDDSGVLSGVGSQYQLDFQKAGVYDYFCKVHSWMTGTVTVS